MRDPLLRAARRIAQGGVVAFTGAGISAESGIPTFRDEGGIWDRYAPDRFGTWDGLVDLAMSRPDELAGFLAELRRAFAGAEPGPAHRALARLEAGGLLEGVVTQNVDGLHQAAGSRRVVELHGSLHRVRCLACGEAARISSQELDAALARAVRGLREAFVASLASLLPRCPVCGGPARPDFVAFEEPVRHLDEATALAEGARTLLVVGTHGEVFPAARIPEGAREAGATVIEVARGRTLVRSDLRLDGAAGRVLPSLVDRALA